MQGAPLLTISLLPRCRSHRHWHYSYSPSVVLPSFAVPLSCLPVKSVLSQITNQNSKIGPSRICSLRSLLLDPFREDSCQFVSIGGSQSKIKNRKSKSKIPT